MTQTRICIQCEQPFPDAKSRQRTCLSCLNKCTECGVELSIENMYPSYWRKHLISQNANFRICRNCKNNSFHEERRRKRLNEESKARLWADDHVLRLEVLCHYAGTRFEFMEQCEKCGLRDFDYDPPSCKSCGVTDQRVLTIDPVAHGRMDERTWEKNLDQSPYRWLKENGYPEQYEVLCLNCRHIKRVTSHHEFSGENHAW